MFLWFSLMCLFSLRTLLNMGELVQYEQEYTSTIDSLGVTANGESKRRLPPSQWVWRTCSSKVVSVRKPMKHWGQKKALLSLATGLGNPWEQRICSWRALRSLNTSGQKLHWRRASGKLAKRAVWSSALCTCFRCSFRFSKEGRTSRQYWQVWACSGLSRCMVRRWIWRTAKLENTCLLQ